jgi:hypothetical protein
VLPAFLGTGRKGFGVRGAAAPTGKSASSTALRASRRRRLRHRSGGSRSGGRRSGTAAATDHDAKQFRWTPDPRATYYNLQLYSGGTLVARSTASAGEKILSVFLTEPVYKFKGPWKWNDRKYKMTNGIYTWYVWPGYGAREKVDYGALLGSATFQVTRAKSL